MTSYRQLLLGSPWLPWRIRASLERWLEMHGRIRLPALYRWLHTGRARDRVQPVTFGPPHHFFGYYEKTPWNASGTLLLAHEVPFNNRPPVAGDQAVVGVVALNRGKEFWPLGQTCAWNWQQGAMLQWHPAQPDRLFIHNDLRNGELVSVVRDVAESSNRIYGRPIYAVTPDGRHAFSLNFARLHTHRPGYGYAGTADPWADHPCPPDDGIHLMDLDTGSSRLIVSLQHLAQNHPSPEMEGQHHWINHIQVSPSSRRIAFFHLWRTGETGWGVRLYTCCPDGSDLQCLLDALFISHYDWLDDRRILVWAKTTKGRTGNFYLCSVGDESRSVVGAGILTEDGHCSFSPDRSWVLNDTYPDRFDMRTLMLYSIERNQRIDLARLYSPTAKWWGEIRCDLHPRWNRDGTKVCVDSVHSGSRQMYVMDLEGIVA